MSEVYPLETRNLTIGYALGRGKHRVIAEGLNLRLYTGQLTCLIGQNGVGKSTLMRTLSGEQKPLEGQVLLFGQDIHQIPPKERAKLLSIVTTERIETPHITGQMLVELGRHPHSDWTGQLNSADNKRVAWALEAVRAQTLAPKRLNEMSDGERQRVMIARALAQECALTLLDEPTAYLDPTRRAEILHLLMRLAHQDLAILVSTHDLDLVLRLTDTLWVLLPDGTMASGTPEDKVLSGAIERAFEGDGITFDQQTGTFTVQRAIIGEAWVIGEGVRAEWTKRALERQGYRLTEGAPRVVRVDDSHWTLEHPNTSPTHHNSIESLLAVL